MSVVQNAHFDSLELDRLFDALAGSSSDEPPAREARRQLIEAYLPMAARIASRYRYRGPSTEDLVQVASMALVGAVDRFDPQRRDQFASFAASTIHGELKKHFRDTGWAVRVPRAIQERCLTVAAVTSDHLARTGLEPTPAELAATLELSPGQVREALDAAAGYRASSLDAASEEHEHLADPESVEDLVEARERWRLASSHIRRLPERDRVVLYLRYFEERQLGEPQRAAG
jgi:RNA polymerase sigma-B factor